MEKKEAKRKYAEAMDKLLGFLKKRDIYPYQEDYDRYFTEEEQYQLLEDLGIKKDLDLFRTENPRIAIFAILNIEALRFQRRLDGENPYITGVEGTSWNRDNKIVFASADAEL